MQDSSMLFWLALEHNARGEMQKFKIYKKGLGEAVNEWIQMLFCNPCGLWLYKVKGMRPENRWNKQLLDKKGKLPSTNRKNSPLNSCPATRTRSKAASKRPLASSVAPTDVYYVPAQKDNPNVGDDHDPDDEADASPCKRRREISAEPRRSTDAAENPWHGQDEMEALWRAMQSSPARNMEVRPILTPDDNLPCATVAFLKCSPRRAVEGP
jgi:hypothetical protein